MFIDTHCHIHEPQYLGADIALQRGVAEGVSKVICVGTSELSSRQAVSFAQSRAHVYASVGVHPHDAKDGWAEVGVQLREHATIDTSPIVAVGEIGLDYFYSHSPRDTQILALEQQLQWALDAKLPVIFHVRDAFEDFWPIFDSFSGIRGVLHSFTDTIHQLENGLARGLYVGVNGISTFTKDKAQQKMFEAIPLDRMLLETDAPFLTPRPYRGKVNEPAFVRLVAENVSERRDIPFETVASATTTNAEQLFAI